MIVVGIHSDLSLEERKNQFPLPAAWGLQSHYQTKLLNVGSASLPPAEAQGGIQPITDVNPAQSTRPITAAFFSFEQLFSELISESLTIKQLF